jgi:hypothetical protein
MLLKLLALGFKEYFSDKFNTFDCIIVLVSLADVSMTLTHFSKLEGSEAI